jgi:hypothetical protein
LQKTKKIKFHKTKDDKKRIIEREEFAKYFFSFHFTLFELNGEKRN